MNDYNDIFGYQVYKPPPEKNLPIIADLNCPGEVITLIDPNADVIKDPAVQKIFKSLDGERTVKIEDLPPDVRYDGWSRKAQYDKQVIARNQAAAAAAGAASNKNLQPQLPVVNQNLLKEDDKSQQYRQEALRQAQLKAMSAKNEDLEFNRQLQETKIALEKEIHRQLVEQLTLRAQKRSVTPEQQALIEKLYLDLRLINPELAFATLKASASLNESGPLESESPPAVATAPPSHQIIAPVATRSGGGTVAGAALPPDHVQIPIQQSAEQIKQRQIRPVPVQMIHSQGSILTETQARNVNRQTRVKPPPQ